VAAQLEVLLDNDVIIKCSCYSLLQELASDVGPPHTLGVLGAARYVVTGHLRRRPDIRDRTKAQNCFVAFLATVVELEPTEDELILAAEIEEAALRAGVGLDGGESQLCAIAARRGSPVLLTGDKRAIQGAETLMQQVRALRSLRGRLVCLEQAIMGIVHRLGPIVVKARICAEPDADKSLSICFECDRSPTPSFTPVGLASYVRHLRHQAPTLLYPSDAW
jgi:hypothetical protein